MTSERVSLLGSHCVQNECGAVCLHWVSGAVCAARAKLKSVSVYIYECWLADFRSRVERVWRSLSPFVAHNEATQTCAARSRQHVEKMNASEEKRAEQPPCAHFLYIWLSAHTQSSVSILSKSDYIKKCMKTIHAQSAHSEPIICVHAALWWLLFTIILP